MYIYIYNNVYMRNAKKVISNLIVIISRFFLGVIGKHTQQKVIEINDNFKTYNGENIMKYV